MSLFDIPLVSLLLSVVISWALFAMLCSLVHEGVAQLKAERGRFMKRYLLQQLQDLPNGVNWASLLYQHGTIDMLSRAPGKPTNDISPHLFAETLIDVVGSAQLVKINAVSTGATSSYSSVVLHNFQLATLALQTSDATTFFRQSLKSAELSAAASGLPVTEGQVYNQLVLNIEKWYNEFSQRLTLWYKKATRQRLLMLGCLLGLVLNVDSIQLFKIYNTDPQVRQAVVGYYQKNATTLTADSTDSGKAQKDKILAFINQVDTANQFIHLPIGTQNSYVFQPRQRWQDWFWKLMGVFISGFAASLGAPFWFSLLQKAISKK